MKFRTLVFALLAVSFIATSLFAEGKSLPQKEIVEEVSSREKIVTHGASQYGSVTIDSLESMGLVKLNGTSVLSHLRVNGSLISSGAKIGHLEVTGEANLTDTVVHNGGFIIGSVQASTSIFEKAITILTQKAVFTATRLEGITVQKDGSFKGKQVIELKNRTIVNGPIHFESGKGEVIVHPGCQLHGAVTGGKVIKKS